MFKKFGKYFNLSALWEGKTYFTGNPILIAVLSSVVKTHYQ